MLRHDPARSGFSPGRGNLTAPTLRWRHYLGGAVQPNQFSVADADDDGVTDLVYIAGFKVLCKHADDTVVWETPSLEALGLVGVFDLDGDGRREVVVTASGGNVLVLEGRTGAVRWEIPAVLRGNTSSVRVVDLDGDGDLDMYVGECVNNPHAAYGFDFSPGLATPRELFRLSAPTNVCGTEQDAFVDLDGDRRPEVLMLTGGFDQIRVFDTRLGTVRSTIQAPMSGPWSAFTTLLVRQLDDDPTPEVIALSNGFARGTNTFGARRVALLDADPSGALQVRWEANADELETGAAALTGDAIGDLDGDGIAEVAMAFRSETTRQWRLEVRHGRDGTLRARVDDTELVGVTTAHDGRPVLLGVANDRALVALRLEGATLRTLWRLEGLRPALAVDPARAAVEALATRPAVLDADDGGQRRMMLLSPFDPTLPPEARTVTALEAWSLDAAPQRLARFDAPTATTITLTQLGARVARPYTQPLVVTSDGYMLALDRALQSTNRLVGSEFTIPGMRMAGYYAGLTQLAHAPIVAMIPGAQGMPPTPAVFVRDSRPALVRLDARGASLAAPPRVVWERPRLARPVLEDLDGDGNPEIAAFDGRDVRALDAQTGQDRWAAMEAAGPVGSTVSSDLVPLRRAGVAGRDLSFLRIIPGRGGGLVALQGTSGAPRWAAFERIPHSGYGQLAAADLVDNDGTDDIVLALNNILLLDGRTGTVAREGGYAPYGVPVIAPFRGTSPDIYLGGMVPDQLFGGDLSLQGRAPAPGFSTMWSAAVRCDDRPAVVRPLPGQGMVERLFPQDLRPDGMPPMAAASRLRLLAGGRVFDSVEALPAGLRPGRLHSVTAMADLDGAGHPAALVGSTDGYLYALDPCTLDLRWSYNFRFPVSEAVVADADGDGTDDVLVTAADGYLYALGRRSLETPGAVRDVDPEAPDTAVDLDEVETFNALAVQWDPVPGATRYQVRALTEGGSALRFPEYVEVTGTSAVLRELPLRYRGRYRFGVLGLDTAGASVEQLTDGVTVVDRSPPTVVLEANPPSFAPGAGVATRLEMRVRDRTALVRTRAWLEDPEGQVLLPVDDYTFPTPSPDRVVRLEWLGIRPGTGSFVAQGRYTLVAEATDVGGQTTTARTTVEVLPPTAMEFRPDPEGCNCRTVGTAHASNSRVAALWGVVLGAGLALGRRRRAVRRAGRRA